jgi:hypothetical protein
MTFPNDEIELMKAKATALFDDGRDIVPLAQARKQIKPAYDWAIKKLIWLNYKRACFDHEREYLQ